MVDDQTNINDFNSQSTVIVSPLYCKICFFLKLNILFLKNCYDGEFSNFNFLVLC